MLSKDLFRLALGLNEPWYVKDVRFDSERRRLDLVLDFQRGSRFCCPECGQCDCPVHDTKERTWRHLDFFQHQTYLTARVARIRCSCCGVKQAEVPWARKNSGFTLLFEIFVLNLAQFMPIQPLGSMAKVHADSLWRIVSHYVEKYHAKVDLSKTARIGIDELSKKIGHHYITVFGDLDESSVVYVADGRKSDTLEDFALFLEEKDIPPEQISEVCVDMWPAYVSGLQERFPKATIIFDRYHIMAMINRAVDQVRRQEAKERQELKKTRYIWLKNKPNLTQKQRATFESLSTMNLKTFRAYRIKETLRQVWTLQNYHEAAQFLKRWYFWATHSRLTPIIEFAKTVKEHWEGLLNYFKSRITNGIIEGINSKIKTAIKRAYGFKSFRYLRTIIYLIAGNLALPTQY